MNDYHLSTSQAAKHLGVSRASIRRWTDQGKLKATRTPGGHRRFWVKDLDRLAEEVWKPTRGHDRG